MALDIQGDCIMPSTPLRTLCPLKPSVRLGPPGAEKSQGTDDFRFHPPAKSRMDIRYGILLEQFHQAQRQTSYRFLLYLSYFGKAASKERIAFIASVSLTACIF